MNKYGVKVGRCAAVARVVLAGIALAATVGFVQGAQAQQVVASEAAKRAQANSASTLLGQSVSVNIRDVPLVQAVNAIAASANVMIQYQHELLDVVPHRVSLQARDIPLGAALQHVLASTNLYAVQSSRTVITIRQGPEASPKQGQAFIVGRVIASGTGNPVIGATVSLEGTSRTVVSGEDGGFRLPVDSLGTYMVQVRALGFGRLAKQVRVNESGNVAVEFAMGTSASVLDEVIVTGTVVATKRRKIATPITVITAEEIAARNITRIEQFFRGEVPGVVALDDASFAYSGANAGPGQFQQSLVYSRGSSDTRGGANPLKTFIDGVEIADPAYLGTIDMQSIERIEIITGPQAATIYGSGAMGGVMQIFTKKGENFVAPTVDLVLRYGMLESSVPSSGRTPTHNDVLRVTGGAGAGFTYSGNASYNYSGQWQPLLYSRSYGLSVGAAHTAGVFTTRASASITRGKNGTAYSEVGRISLAESGEFPQGYEAGFGSVVNFGLTRQRINTSSAQNLSLNVTYRPRPWWGHDLTMGISANRFALVPMAPVLSQPADTLFLHESKDVSRTSISYNTSFILPAIGIFASTGSIGLTGSTSESTTLKGNTGGGGNTFYTNPQISKAPANESWGGFGTWRIELFRQLYYTVSMRVERNPAYGNNVKVDVTPSNGVAWMIERGDVTVKLMGSYGRATRAPWGAEGNADLYQTVANAEPNPWMQNRRYNPDLRPEYESGPQGRFELFYGNLGSLAMNFYRGKVTDLSLLVFPVDSTRFRVIGRSSDEYLNITQWQNVGNLKKQGIETTASLNLGPLAFRGTYSWNDSRITVVDPTSLAVRNNGWYEGMSFKFLLIQEILRYPMRMAGRGSRVRRV